IGLQEVKRIRAEMQRLMRATGFAQDLAAFFEFLRTDPRFFFSRPEDLLAGYREIAKRADPEVIKLFGRVPRLPYGVVPMPAHNAASRSAGAYDAGSLAAGRPGYFSANLSAVDTRPKWEMEALVLHEAVPGHHLQIALAQEQPDLPNFRKYGGYEAYGEGWALYAETLGHEMGFYKDPYSHFGALNYQMWRAVRRLDRPAQGGRRLELAPPRYALIPRSLAAVPPSIATRSSSLRPGVPRMWSTDVLVHGNG